MAISGCDFVCKNEECKYKGSGIVITSPWPLGDIDKVINAKNAPKDVSFLKQMEELKKQGRKLACINLPDSDNIPVIGYRVHMWCEKCPCLWNYDAIIPENITATDANALIDEVVKAANIPVKCFKCNHELKTFAQVIDADGDGIKCTSCSARLKFNVWFSNEKGPVEKLNPLIKLPDKETK